MKIAVVLTTLVGLTVTARLDGLGHHHSSDHDQSHGHDHNHSQTHGHDHDHDDDHSNGHDHDHSHGHNTDDRHGQNDNHSHDHDHSHGHDHEGSHRATKERLNIQTDSLRHREHAVIRGKEAGGVKGSYSWTAPNGETFTVEYVADERGYRPIIHRERSRYSLGTTSTTASSTGLSGSQNSGSLHPSLFISGVSDNEQATLSTLSSGTRASGGESGSFYTSGKSEGSVRSSSQSGISSSGLTSFSAQNLPGAAHEGHSVSSGNSSLNTLQRQSSNVVSASSFSPGGSRVRQGASGKFSQQGSEVTVSAGQGPGTSSGIPNSSSSVSSSGSFSNVNTKDNNKQGSKFLSSLSFSSAGQAARRVAVILAGRDVPAVATQGQATFQDSAGSGAVGADSGASSTGGLSNASSGSSGSSTGIRSESHTNPITSVNSAVSSGSFSSQSSSSDHSGTSTTPSQSDSSGFHSSLGSIYSSSSGSGSASGGVRDDVSVILAGQPGATDGSAAGSSSNNFDGIRSDSASSTGSRFGSQSSSFRGTTSTLSSAGSVSSSDSFNNVNTKDNNKQGSKFLSSLSFSSAGQAARRVAVILAGRDVPAVATQGQATFRASVGSGAVGADSGASSTGGLSNASSESSGSSTGIRSESHTNPITSVNSTVSLGNFSSQSSSSDHSGTSTTHSQSDSSSFHSSPGSIYSSTSDSGSTSDGLRDDVSVILAGLPGASDWSAASSSSNNFDSIHSDSASSNGSRFGSQSSSFRGTTSTLSSAGKKPQVPVSTGPRVSSTSASGSGSWYSTGQAGEGVSVILAGPGVPERVTRGQASFQTSVGAVAKESSLSSGSDGSIFGSSSSDSGASSGSYSNPITGVSSPVSSGSFSSQSSSSDHSGIFSSQSSSSDHSETSTSHSQSDSSSFHSFPGFIYSSSTGSGSASGVVRDGASVILADQSVPAEVTLGQTTFQVSAGTGVSSGSSSSGLNGINSGSSGSVHRGSLVSLSNSVTSEESLVSSGGFSSQSSTSQHSESFGSHSKTDSSTSLSSSDSRYSSHSLSDSSPGQLDDGVSVILAGQGALAGTNHGQATLHASTGTRDGSASSRFSGINAGSDTSSGFKYVSQSDTNRETGLGNTSGGRKSELSHLSSSRFSSASTSGSSFSSSSGQTGEDVAVILAGLGTAAGVPLDQATSQAGTGGGTAGSFSSISSGSGDSSESSFGYQPISAADINSGIPLSISSNVGSGSASDNFQFQSSDVTNFPDSEKLTSTSQGQINSQVSGYQNSEFSKPPSSIEHSSSHTSFELYSSGISANHAGGEVAVILAGQTGLNRVATQGSLESGVDDSSSQKSSDRIESTTTGSSGSLSDLSTGHGSHTVTGDKLIGMDGNLNINPGGTLTKFCSQTSDSSNFDSQNDNISDLGAGSSGTSSGTSFGTQAGSIKNVPSSYSSGSSSLQLSQAQNFGSSGIRSQTDSSGTYSSLGFVPSSSSSVSGSSTGHIGDSIAVILDGRGVPAGTTRGQTTFQVSAGTGAVGADSGASSTGGFNDASSGSSGSSTGIRSEFHTNPITSVNSAVSSVSISSQSSSSDHSGTSTTHSQFDSSSFHSSPGSIYSSTSDSGSASGGLRDDVSVILAGQTGATQGQTSSHTSGGSAAVSFSNNFDGVHSDSASSTGSRFGSQSSSYRETTSTLSSGSNISQLPVSSGSRVSSTSASGSGSWYSTGQAGEGVSVILAGPGVPEGVTHGQASFQTSAGIGTEESSVSSGSDDSASSSSSSDSGASSGSHSNSTTGISSPVSAGSFSSQPSSSDHSGTSTFHSQSDSTSFHFSPVSMHSSSTGSGSASSGVRDGVSVILASQRVPAGVIRGQTTLQVSDGTHTSSGSSSSGLNGISSGSSGSVHRGLVSQSNSVTSEESLVSSGGFSSQSSTSRHSESFGSHSKTDSSTSLSSSDSRYSSHSLSDSSTGQLDNGVSVILAGQGASAGTNRGQATIHASTGTRDGSASSSFSGINAGSDASSGFKYVSQSDTNRETGLGNTSGGGKSESSHLSSSRFSSASTSGSSFSSSSGQTGEGVAVILAGLGTAAGVPLDQATSQAGTGGGTAGGFSSISSGSGDSSESSFGYQPISAADINSGIPLSISGNVGSGSASGNFQFQSSDVTNFSDSEKLTSTSQGQINSKVSGYQNSAFSKPPSPTEHSSSHTSVELYSSGISANHAGGEVSVILAGQNGLNRVATQGSLESGVDDSSSQESSDQIEGTNTGSSGSLSDLSTGHGSHTVTGDKLKGTDGSLNINAGGTQTKFCSQTSDSFNFDSQNDNISDLGAGSSGTSSGTSFGTQAGSIKNVPSSYSSGSSSLQLSQAQNFGSSGTRSQTDSSGTYSSLGFVPSSSSSGSGSSTGHIGDTVAVIQDGRGVPAGTTQGQTTFQVSAGTGVVGVDSGASSTGGLSDVSSGSSGSSTGTRSESHTNPITSVNSTVSSGSFSSQSSSSDHSGTSTSHSQFDSSSFHSSPGSIYSLSGSGSASGGLRDDVSVFLAGQTGATQGQTTPHTSGGYAAGSSSNNFDSIHSDTASSTGSRFGSQSNSYRGITSTLPSGSKKPQVPVSSGSRVSSTSASVSSSQFSTGQVGEGVSVILAGEGVPAGDTRGQGSFQTTDGTGTEESSVSSGSDGSISGSSGSVNGANTESHSNSFTGVSSPVSSGSFSSQSSSSGHSGSFSSQSSSSDHPGTSTFHSQSDSSSFHSSPGSIYSSLSDSDSASGGLRKSVSVILAGLHVPAGVTRGQATFQNSAGTVISGSVPIVSSLSSQVDSSKTDSNSSSGSVEGDVTVLAFAIPKNTNKDNSPNTGYDYHSPSSSDLHFPSGSLSSDHTASSGSYRGLVGENISVNLAGQNVPGEATRSKASFQVSAATGAGSGSSSSELNSISSGSSVSVHEESLGSQSNSVTGVNSGVSSGGLSSQSSTSHQFGSFGTHSQSYSSTSHSSSGIKHSSSSSGTSTGSIYPGIMDGVPTGVSRGQGLIQTFGSSVPFTSGSVSSSPIKSEQGYDHSIKTITRDNSYGSPGSSSGTGSRFSLAIFRGGNSGSAAGTTQGGVVPSSSGSKVSYGSSNSRVSSIQRLKNVAVILARPGRIFAKSP